MHADAGRLQQTRLIGFGYRALIWFYNRWQKLWGRKPFPLASGLLPRGVKNADG